MIRPLAFFWALWRFIAKTWADRNRHDPRGQEVDCPTTDYARATVAPNSDQEVDCPITDYTKEIESNPNDVTAYLARGTAHLKAFAYDRAIADFTKAIELKPNNDSAYTKRGSAHTKGLSTTVPSPTSQRPLRSTRGQPLLIATWAGPTRRLGTKNGPSLTIEWRLKSTHPWKHQETTSSF
jgi:tetratricopeptide (TPR) repeat protein